MIVELKKICKSFGAQNVLDEVDFSIGEGEICALLGENGAGKSTLMNILGGVLDADSGSVVIDGKTMRFSSPADSLAAGIAFIHQELNLIGDLTVYENIFLPDFPKKGLLTDRKTMIGKTKELFEKLGIAIDPSAYVRTLDSSEKQFVEIARALYRDASLIIMDEPTTSLTPAEIARVFEIMRGLRARGISMIFISHKLGEVVEICDRYVVLRNGVTVSAGKIADVTAEKLAADMVGHEIGFGRKHEVAEYGKDILRLEHLSDGKHFFDISLSLREGEILGVTGLLGDGRSELFGAVFGIGEEKHTGKIFFEGKEISPKSSAEAYSLGIAYLPDDRKDNGIIPDMTVLDNGTVVTLRDRCKAGFFSKKRQKSEFSKEARDLSIRMSGENASINALSGGNQQKVVLAKWLMSNPKLLILDNPTQGVDVGAKEEIHLIIEGLAKKGVAVVVLSAEAQEIIGICDRCIVMFHGKMAGMLEGAQMNEQKMMMLATGAAEGK